MSCHGRARTAISSALEVCVSDHFVDICKHGNLEIFLRQFCHPYIGFSSTFELRRMSVKKSEHSDRIELFGTNFHSNESRKLTYN